MNQANDVPAKHNIVPQMWPLHRNDIFCCKTPTEEGGVSWGGKSCDLIGPQLHNKDLWLGDMTIDDRQKDDLIGWNS